MTTLSRFKLLKVTLTLTLSLILTNTYKIMQITALTAILARRINIKELTSKSAKIMKILSPECSLIAR